MTGVFRLRARLGAPPDTVYLALTDPAALRKWLAEHAEISLADGRYEFWGRYTPDGRPGRQRLLAAEPDSLLRLAWWLDDEWTTVELRLSADEPDGTLLTLSQSGAATWEELVAGTGRRVVVNDFWRLSIANLASYVEGLELAPKRDFGKHIGTSARLDLSIGAEPEEVYASLIEPDRLNRWIAADAEVTPEAGGRLSLSKGGAPLKILELEPGRVLAHSWPEYDGLDPVVRWELARDDGRTRLTIVHSGFDDNGESAGQALSGWHAFLAELKRMHEIGPGWRPIQYLMPNQPHGLVANEWFGA